jgi:predicted ester cyclase
MSSEELTTRARRMVEEVLNQGDLAVAHELISPDCVHHFPGQVLAPGTAGVRDWLSQAHHIFPDFHALVEREFAADHQVAQLITGYGTHAGEFLGIAPTGRQVAFTIIGISRAGPDGRFTEHWWVADLLSVLRQLGMTGVPVTGPSGSRGVR